MKIIVDNSEHETAVVKLAPSGKPKAQLREQSERSRTPFPGASGLSPPNATPLAPAVDIVQADIANLGGACCGFDLALLIEAIEHMTAGALKAVSQAIFGKPRPRSIIATTPNIEFNHFLGVPSRRPRHPGRRFEWMREEFGAWCSSLAGDFLYSVCVGAISAARTRAMAARRN